MFTPTLFGAVPPRTPPALPVAGGRVDCIRLGHPTSIERCLECPYLVRVEGTDPSHVMCQAQPQIEDRGWPELDDL